MITELKPTNLIAVEVPLDSKDTFSGINENIWNSNISLPKGEYKILGEVTKDKIGFDVEPYIEKLNSRALYKNYRYNHGFWFSSPYQSFYSLLAANGLYFENPVGYPTEDEYEGKEWAAQAIIEDKAAWQSFEDKLIKGKLLILEKL